MFKFLTGGTHPVNTRRGILFYSLRVQGLGEAGGSPASWPELRWKRGGGDGSRRRGSPRRVDRPPPRPRGRPAGEVTMVDRRRPMRAALGVDAPGHQIDGRELLRAHGEVGRLRRGSIWEGGPWVRVISPGSAARERGGRRRNRARGARGFVGRGLGGGRRRV